MTPEQLLLFIVIVAIWVLLAMGILPWLPGRRLRHDLRIAGYVVLAVLLLLSLLTAPSVLLWLEYTLVALLILVALLAYNHWALREAE